MANVPVISISFDDSVTENDNDAKNICIDDAKTDIEDLDSDSEKKDNLLNFTLNVKRGSVTDVENFTSEEEKENYDVEEYDAKIKLDDFLDQGSVDESAAFFGTKKKDVHKLKSKSNKPTSNNLLEILDIEKGGVTDCEDMLDSGPEESEPEIKYEFDDNPIVLEDNNSIDIQDSSKKRTERYMPKIKEPSSDSSDEENVRSKIRHPPHHYHHHHSKRHSKIENSKSDIENMLFSDEEKQSRRSSNVPTNVNEADEITLEASDVDLEAETPTGISKSMTFPEINITFATDDNDEKVLHIKPKSLLGLPDRNEEALTDIEDLDSSESEVEGACARPRHKLKSRKARGIPKAVIKDSAATDEEDMGQISEAEDLLDPCFKDDDVPLPSPIREMKILKEDEKGQPIVEVLPIADDVLLGIDKYSDGGVTDYEDCSDDNDDNENYDINLYTIDQIPDLDDGNIQSADKTIDKDNPSRPVSSMSSGTLNVILNENPLTDTEELMIGGSSPGGCELRRRRGKTRHNISKNAGFLVVAHANDGGHTDVEEMDFDEDPKVSYHYKRRPTQEIAIILNSQDTLTDEECISGAEDGISSRATPDSRPLSALNQENYCSTITSQESLDVNKFSFKSKRISLPVVCKKSPSPDIIGAFTDTEDIHGVSDADEPYSRAQTATPLEVQIALDNTLEQSEIHEANVGLFDAKRERNNLKCARDIEALTDVSDIELPPEECVSPKGNGKQIHINNWMNE